MHGFLAAVGNLARSPGYAAAFILTLGLGIGANTAIFSAVRAVLLKPIPYCSGERLLHLRHKAVQNAIPNATWSVPEINDYRAASKTIESFAEFSALDFNMLGHLPASARRFSSPGSSEASSSRSSPSTRRLLVAVVLSVTALAASWIPAWRAARVAPIEVLRVD
jgi:ABC-type antimicrobial peptide transport system permease subunit